MSVAVPFCVFDDKDHNFTASFVIRFINGSTARTEPLLTLSPHSLSGSYTASKYSENIKSLQTQSNIYNSVIIYRYDSYLLSFISF